MCVPAMWLDSASAYPFINGRKLKAIAVASPTRVATMPEVPTVSEQGIKGFEGYAWQGLVVPTGTPPETIAKFAAALQNRLQGSINLALGSAVASIGLTIPAVVAAAVWFQLPLTLGLEAKDMALLALTFVVGAITLGSGRTNMMQGAVHLVIFAAFLFLALVP